MANKNINFFIVGFPKCGTTWVTVHLKEHPQVSIPIKEPHYFCKDFHEESKKFRGKVHPFFITEYEEYIKLFDINKEILGEQSVFYIYSKVAAKEILDYNENAKIIINLREPVSFLISYHNQLLNTFDEEVSNFKKALELEKIRKKGKLIPKTVKFPSIVYYSEKVEFSKNIKKFKKFFGEDQIKIILLDDIKEKPEIVYSEILNFLNLKQYKINNFKVVNKASSFRNEYLRRIYLSLYGSPLLRKIYENENTPKFLKKSLKNAYNFILKLGKEEGKKKIDEEFSFKLKKKFKPEVKKLSNLLGMDLEALWGYDKI